MKLEYVKALSAFVLYTVTFAATVLPMFIFRASTPQEVVRRASNMRIISFLNCFGAGVFLGTCLLHLFPDVQEQMDTIFKQLNIVPNYPVAEFLFGFGFLVILIVEQIVLNFQDNSSEHTPILAQEPSVDQLITTNRRLSHESLLGDESAPLCRNHNYGTMEPPTDDAVAIRRPSTSNILRSLLLVLALSLHSIFEGLAIGLQTSAQSDVRILVAVLIHKTIIAFTLGLNLQRSSLGPRNMVKSGLFFSLSSPVGILLGTVIVDVVQGLAMVVASGILQGLATGTFLYVTLFEILPRELSCGRDRMVKMACMVLGYSIVSLLLTFLPE